MSKERDKAKEFAAVFVVLGAILFLWLVVLPWWKGFEKNVDEFDKNPTKAEQLDRDIREELQRAKEGQGS